MMFVRLVIASTVLSILAFTDELRVDHGLGGRSWVCIVSYVALALYAVSQGC